MSVGARRADRSLALMISPQQPTHRPTNLFPSHLPIVPFSFNRLSCSLVLYFFPFYRQTFITLLFNERHEKVLEERHRLHSVVGWVSAYL